MRVAILSGNAPRHNAVGNQIAEKVRFFQERGAEVRLLVQDARQLHPELRSCTVELPVPSADGPAWDYLRQADLVFAVYAQYFDLLQYLPLLAGMGPRVVFDYLGVTPAELWNDPNRERLEQSARRRGYVWCADHALTTSQANRRELLDATRFPAEHVTTLPLAVDTQRFRAGMRERFLQRRLGIDGRILLFVGRLAGNKRAPLLIEALPQLPYEMHVVLVGDCSDVYAEESGRCQLLAQELGVADRVHFIGQLHDDDLASAYHSADVLVMPSRHEGFCVPVLEAMASGLPVIASRSAALPEAVGDAGLTFVPDDVDDLVRQLRRVLWPEASADNHVGLAIAVVSFRFGPDIVGGAETSLRNMAKALQDAGHRVEVFTTCTTSESAWKNDVPAGTTTLDGLTVHRFPIDTHDVMAPGDIVREILEADGRVAAELEQRYLEQSIHSSALLAELSRRVGEFTVIITGPYLFGLTADVARQFPDRTLLAPCFHDEPLARLTVWPSLYGNVGGLLYHSAEEQGFAQEQLGVNHPNARAIGARVAIADGPAAPRVNMPRPYVVYCGRYSEQKNVPLLLDWAQRFQAEKPGRLDFVFLGQGDVTLPGEPWLHDLGRVDEATKRSVLSGARALVQFSTQESLSLVVLEAWAERTPVIVHRDCAVLAGQIGRAQAGVAVVDQAEFSAALDDLQENDAEWRLRGMRGRDHVSANYASREDYVARLTKAIEQMGVPIARQMRERGLERAAAFTRERWQQRFAEFVEQVLTTPARHQRDSLRIEPLRDACRAGAGSGTLLLPVRLVNTGTHAAIPDGPGRTVICCEVRDDDVVLARKETSLPALLLPGQVHAAAVPIPVPADAGTYRLVLWLERLGVTKMPQEPVELPLHVDAELSSKRASCASAFLDTVQQTLPRTHELQQLPADYIDVTEGRLAPAKRWIKRKLLNNFKHAYVDVLSRQQSQVNGQFVLMIQQLAECCAMLDHAIAGLHQRMDGLEAKMEQALEVRSAREVSCERKEAVS